MRPLYIAILGGLALVAGGYFVAGGPSGTRTASAPSARSDGAVREAAASERMVTLRVDNMYCASCPYMVREALRATPGVVNAEVSFRDKLAVVTYDATKTEVAALVDATGRMGYPSRPVSN